MMDLRRLRAFVTVAETSHFGRAADRLRLAQPAVTQQIQQLERDLGVRLLDRGPRAVALTAVGQEFLREAKAALEQVERAALVAKRAQRGELGHVEISHVSSIAYSGILGKLLLSFGEICPDVTVSVHEADLEPQVTALREGSVDVALVRLPVGPPSQDIKALTLRRESVLACLRHDHPKAEAIVSVATLAEENILATHLREGYGFYDTQLRICRAAGFEPRIVNRSRQFATIVSLVSAGRGVALVPESVSRLQLPDVIYRPIDERRITADVAVLYRPHSLPPATSRFIDHCARFAEGG